MVTIQTLDVTKKINTGQRVIHQVLKAGVDSGLRSAVYNKDFDEALTDAVKVAAIGTATGPITDKIDASFASGSMNTVTHTSSSGFPISESLPQADGFPVVEQKSNLLFFSKRKTEEPPRVHAPNPDHGHVSAPGKFKGKQGALPGFPESKYAGQTNDKRDKWILKDKTFAAWDKRHGAVDLFNQTGKKHLGKYDPDTGNKLKDAKPEITSKPS